MVLIAVASCRTRFDRRLTPAARPAHSRQYRLPIVDRFARKRRVDNNIIDSGNYITRRGELWREQTSDTSFPR